MKNPYVKFLKINKKKAVKEAELGRHRRLRTHDESIIRAKNIRFRTCQKTIVRYTGFASKAYVYSSGKHPKTKDEIMKNNGIEYPFTAAQANDEISRPIQIALELGWKYKGKATEGKANRHIEEFFNACLAIPIKLYYSEDKFDDDK